MKDVVLFTTCKNKEFNCEEEVGYNLTKQIAEIIISPDDYEDDLVLQSEERFQEDTKVITKLAKRAIPKIEEKIQNNKIVLHYSKGNDVEVDKAKKHLNRNMFTLDVVKQWIKEHE